jgi:hypothetical protein
MQGCGVRTPRAAVVAAATVGFDTVVHMPQGVSDDIGATSATVAAGLPDTMTAACDVTFNVPGDVPKLHMYVAPVTTAIAIKPS